MRTLPIALDAVMKLCAAKYCTDMKNITGTGMVTMTIEAGAELQITTDTKNITVMLSHTIEETMNQDQQIMADVLVEVEREEEDQVMIT